MIMMGEGWHLFSFHAVDPIGNVSPPQNFSASIIAPTPSLAMTMSVSRTPSPTRTPYINVPLNFTTKRGSFDIVGEIDGQRISTTIWGYEAKLRIGGNIALMEFAEPVNLSGIVFSVDYFRFSSNAIRLSFTERNTNPEPSRSTSA
jgi:hypothetical protein